MVSPAFLTLLFLFFEHIGHALNSRGDAAGVGRCTRVCCRKVALDDPKFVGLQPSAMQSLPKGVRPEACQDGQACFVASGELRTMQAEQDQFANLTCRERHHERRGSYYMA
jgi:hypothetical protein